MDEYDVVVLVSWAACLLVHHVISPYIFSRYFPKYRSLPWNIRMEWNSRIVSSLHATLTAVMSTVALAISNQLWIYPIFATAPLAKVTMAISVGYMLSDMVSMPLYWVGTDLYVYLVHHGLSALAFFISTKYDILVFFAMFRLTSEFSTPFANQRWFYLQLGCHKNSAEVLFNTWLFSLLFFVFRNLVIPGYWFMVFRACRSHHFRDLMHSFPSACVIWITTSVILDVLNLHWGRKIIVKGIRITAMAMSKVR